MSRIDDGGTAFPAPVGGSSFTGGDGYTTWQYPGSQGMSLRAWLAGMAMASYNANESTWDNPAHQRAKWACEDADALIAALGAGKAVTP